MNKTIDIFKTTVFSTEIKNDLYINYFKNIIKKEIKHNRNTYMSNVGGFQTQKFDMIDDKNILNNIFIDPIINFLNTFKTKKKFNIKLSGYWINCNKNNHYNKMHNHIGNFSGIYYIEVPKDSGKLVFQNADLLKSYDNNYPFIEDANTYSNYSFDVKKYELYLFPSETLHFVEPNFSNKERISVAFNLMFE